MAGPCRRAKLQEYRSVCSQKVTEGREEESSISTAKFHLLSGVTLFISFEKTMRKDEISDLIELYIHFISIHTFIIISEQGPCLLLPSLPYTKSYNVCMCTDLKKPPLPAKLELHI